jgi:hypothetical protein
VAPTLDKLATGRASASFVLMCRAEGGLPQSQARDQVVPGFRWFASISHGHWLSDLDLSFSRSAILRSPDSQ